MGGERTPDANREDKKAAGEAAANLVRDGMILGLGTGSTVAWAIRRIGEMIEEGIDVLGVPTSYQSQELAISCGIPLTSLDENPRLDLAIDGADQIDHSLVAIKGGGAAHTREKIVSSSADAFVIVADATKYVGVLDASVPLEVLPFAARLVTGRLEIMGAAPSVRKAKMKDGPVISDNGNLIVDVDFGTIEDPTGLASDLSVIPGVVEHGIFENVDRLILTRAGKIEVIERVKDR